MDREQLTCSICLDLLEDEVTVPCGHSYCRRCIEGFWNTDDDTVYCPQCGCISPLRHVSFPTCLHSDTNPISTPTLNLRPMGSVATPTIRSPFRSGDMSEWREPPPQCRHTFITFTFTPRPGEHVVESMKKTGLQDASPDHCYAGPGASGQLQENICSLHDEKKKVFCRKTELISSMERRGSEVRQQIREQQERQVSGAKEVRRRVEQELSELRRGHAELQQLSLTEDHIHLQRFTSSLSRTSESTHPVSFRLTPPEPKTRAEFLRYSHPITLDPNTAHRRLSLSKGNRKVTRLGPSQQTHTYPDHPERFTEWAQVLSREALTGRCYWEAEWVGDRVDIAVSYKDISRKESSDESGFGLNDKSWSLWADTKQGYQFRHRDSKTPLPGCVSSRQSRVGVYVDHFAGTLSFYRVSADTMTLLHTEHNTFTHNLHAGLWLSRGTTAELCDLK